MKVVIENYPDEDTVLYDSEDKGYAESVVIILEDGQRFRLTEREELKGRVLDVNAHEMISAYPRAANVLFLRSERI